MDKVVEKGYIPLDKSWMIRLGVLDLTRGSDATVVFLEQQQSKLSTDLKSLLRASVQWKTREPVNVGESGTLYRFLRFAAWKMNENKEFVLEGTLKNRKICNNPEIINWDLSRLLGLDNGTSQWASASVIMGNKERLTDPPYKLQVTYDAVEHWESAKSKGISWSARYDETILMQAQAYLKWLDTRRFEFHPKHSEDYCLARAFGIITAEEGEKRWPGVRGHESDRIDEMERALQQKTVTSRDHRVVQAIVMLRGADVSVQHPESVEKSWPQFWQFMRNAQELVHS